MLGTTLGFIDAVGLVLALTAVVMAIRLVIRTEKELDKAAKFLLVNAVILVLANLASINDFFGGIVPDSTNRIIFHSSRVLAIICYIFAMHYLIKITEKQN
jgi:hypothetical protein